MAMMSTLAHTTLATMITIGEGTVKEEGGMVTHSARVMIEEHITCNKHIQNCGLCNNIVLGTSIHHSLLSLQIGLLQQRLLVI